MLVDLRLLRSFVVLADELHFTRAAERLHVAQPALSQQIGRLERQVGVELFARAATGVTLTDAGRVLLARVRPAVAAVDAGVEDARRVGRGQGGVLRVGFISSLAAPVVPLIAAAFRERAPTVELRLSERSMIAQLAELRAGRLDVALFTTAAIARPCWRLRGGTGSGRRPVRRRTTSRRCSGSSRPASASRWSAGRRRSSRGRA